jgi:hypothetical protein
MKKVMRLLIAALLLTCAASTVSLAEGGSPIPTCSPSHCQ